MKITKVTVIPNPHGLDKVLFETDLPNPIYPFKGFASFQLDTASLGGRKYVAEHFTEIDNVEVIDRSTEN